MGNYIAVTAMVFTNFLIDAPLTKVICNYLNPKIKARLDKKAEAKQNA